MDIENMKAFVKVAECKSISDAARKLHYLQSNLSAKVKRVETYYNQKLFIREPRGVELTAKGAVLYQQFKEMIFLWEETENKMKRQDASLRLGTVVSIGVTQFSQALARLKYRNPSLEVTIKTGSADSIEKQILNEKIDIAYFIGKLGNSHIRYEKLGIEELVLVGDNISNTTDFKEYLRNKNLLVLTDHCLYSSILQNIFADLKIDHGETIEVGDIDAIIQFALMGMGISLIPKRLVIRKNISSFLEIPSLNKFVDLYLITRSNHELTPIEKQFIQLSQELALIS
ncbi:LysR family transcriptional regulator [Sporolactobacillus pectinivorans]|uniref:LysR family transcriptional regulator n=1 Tax=Sporolactobacillus pectinivorans TaxID=1591408 RepID=UPI000C25E6DC|nr:LysR family transcriptional regulator [Sporolactobacillus pectinivorans]